MRGEADEDEVDIVLEAVSGSVEELGEAEGGLWSYLRADSKGWRMASFFATASWLASVLFSVSRSVFVNVDLEKYVLATDYRHTTDRLAISIPSV